MTQMNQLSTRSHEKIHKKKRPAKKHICSQHNRGTIVSSQYTT